MTDAIQTNINQDQYDKIILHSGVVRAEIIGDHYYEGRQCDNGELCVVVYFGSGAATLYSGFGSIDSFFEELRRAVDHSGRKEVPWN